MFDELVKPNETVKYNFRFCAVLLNVLIGFVRIFIFFPTLIHFLGSIPYTMATFKSSIFTDMNSIHSFFVSYRLIVELASFILILQDCTVSSTAVMGYGTFEQRSRSGFAVLSHQSGYGGNIGLFTFRLMFYSIVFISANFSSFDLFSSFKNITHGDDNFMNLLHSPSLIIIGCIIYAVLAVIVAVFSNINERWVSHPQTSPYIADPETKELTTREWFRYGTYLFTFNNIFMIYVFTSFLMHIKKLREQHFHFSQSQIEMFTLLIIVQIILIIRSTYLVTRRLVSRDVSTNFILNFWFFVYILAMIEMTLKNKNDHILDIYGWYMLIMFALNVIYFLIHIRVAINFAIYANNWIFSRQFVALVTSYISVIFLITGGFMALQSNGLDWFRVHLEWPPFIQELISLAKIAQDTIKTCLNAVAVIKAIGAALGSALCQIVFAMIIVAIAMMAIPFGLGSGAWFAKKVVAIFRQLGKILKGVGKLSGPFNKSKPFLSKIFKLAKEIMDVMTFGPGKMLAQFLLMRYFFIFIPLLFTMLCVAFVFWERKSLTSQSSFGICAGFSLFVLGLSFGCLVLYDLMFSITIDLLLVRISFPRCQGLIWLQIGHVTTILGVACFALSIIFGETDGNTKICCFHTRDFHCPCSNDETEPRIGENKFAFCCRKMSPKFLFSELNEGKHPKKLPQNKARTFGKRLMPCLFFEDDRIYNEGMSIDEYENKIPQTNSQFLMSSNTEGSNYLVSTLNKGIHHKLETGFEDDEEENKVRYSGSLLGALFDKFCPCFRRKNAYTIETIGMILGKIMSRIVKYFVEDLQEDTDPRPLCPWCCTNAFPCCHYNTNIPDCCTRPYPCNCCGFEVEFDSQDYTSFINKVCKPSKFGDLLLFLPPISAVLGSFALVYLSVTNEWVTFKTSPGTSFENIRQDQTPGTTDGSVKGQDDEKAVTCPIYELGAIAMSVIFQFLSVFFKAFIKLILKLAGFSDTLDSIKDVENLVKMAMRFVFNLFTVIDGCQIILMSFVVTFTDYFTRFDIVKIAVYLIVPAYYMLVTLPMVLIGIIKMIPFFEFDVIFLKGYYYALYALFLIILAILFIMMDWLCPILAPVKPDKFNEQVDIEKREGLDPLHLNKYLDTVEDIVSNKFYKILPLKNYTYAKRDDAIDGPLSDLYMF